MDKPPKRLLDRVKDIIRLKHYSIRTEKSYISWMKRYIIYHNKRHPKEMGKQEIESFLTHLAVDLNVAASTQNQGHNHQGHEALDIQAVPHMGPPAVTSAGAKKIVSMDSKKGYSLASRPPSEKCLRCASKNRLKNFIRPSVPCNRQLWLAPEYRQALSWKGRHRYKVRITFVHKKNRSDLDLVSSLHGKTRLYKRYLFRNSGDMCRVW